MAFISVEQALYRIAMRVASTLSPLEPGWMPDRKLRQTVGNNRVAKAQKLAAGRNVIATHPIVVAATRTAHRLH